MMTGSAACTVTVARRKLSLNKPVTNNACECMVKALTSPA